MTQHRAQTVQLVNLLLQHRVPSGDVAWTDLARARRFTELQAFAELLRSWGEKVPDTGLGHSDEGKHAPFDARIPGVLAGKQMHALGQSTDREFTRAWLRELIRHEQGAVRIAAAEVAEGQNAKAVAMAREDKREHAALVSGSSGSPVSDRDRFAAAWPAHPPWWAPWSVWAGVSRGAGC